MITGGSICNVIQKQLSISGMHTSAPHSKAYVMENVSVKADDDAFLCRFKKMGNGFNMVIFHICDPKSKRGERRDRYAVYSTPAVYQQTGGSLTEKEFEGIQLQCDKLKV